MLVGLHVATNFEMYRQNSEKALLGGGGIAPPPVPPGIAAYDVASYPREGVFATAPDCIWKQKGRRDHA